VSRVRWRRTLRRLAAVGAITTTVAVARRAAPPTFDQELTSALSRSRGTSVDRAVAVFTDLGSVYGLVGCSIALAAGGEVRLGIRTAASGSVAWVAAQLTKDLVDRQRPYELGTAELLVSVPHGSSWPSGHSAVAGAMADTVSRQLSVPGKVGAWLAAAGVAASRLHVGAHHATDTLAGLALGVLSAELSDAVLDRVLPTVDPSGDEDVTQDGSANTGVGLA